MKIREYGYEEHEADGHDEGGYYKLVDAPETPARLRARMQRCSGCHDAFYNGRVNGGANHCWSLDNDENFKGRGKPRCYH